MDKIKNFLLPGNTNQLYKNEAISSIVLTRAVADKINEIVDALNKIAEDDLVWKQAQEGKIRKGVLYMKDNLVNSLYNLLKIYDHGTIKEAMLDAYGTELLNMRVFATPQMFGAVGNGIVNDTAAIEKAIASLDEGGILFFPKGTYLMKGKAVSIDKKNITFAGEGLILCDYGFRPKASNFKAFGLRMEATAYSQDCRAFMIENEQAKNGYLEGFTFKDCSFKNFFYSICVIGGAYNHDGTEAAIGYPVRDLVIENCHSSTYTDQNAGHFQCIQVENIAYINNRTYGGKNASSYNAIKGNGYIRVIGNYDHNNSYASCEIENSSRKAVIANNTFNSKIWVDDSFDAVINGNTTEEGILITVGSYDNDTDNIVISNNTCKNIRCERFGDYVGGVICNVHIIGNTVKGNNTHGIWIHGNAVTIAKISNNIVTGSNTNAIAIQRSTEFGEFKCFIHNNFGNNQNLLIAGTGGEVYAYDNVEFNVSGNRDSLPISHLEKEFNGLKVTDTNGDAWRINISTTGQVTTTKY